MSKKTIKTVNRESEQYASIGDRAVLEMYQAFMAGYVKRINDASFNVTIGGVRIGSAKYTRLAQINLRSRIITFSRFAVENVPERSRRYLVLHELAHVKETNHNHHFWAHVERFEPNYKQVSRELQTAFAHNVRSDQKKRLHELLKQSDASLEHSARILGSRLMNNKTVESLLLSSQQTEITAVEEADENYECMENEFSMWDSGACDGTVNGGSDEDFC